jgi:UDP-N-acetyl-D-glucosamine dehydrogenase
VVGIDVDERKIQELTAGRSYVKDVSSEDVNRLVKSGAFRVSSDVSVIAELDTVDICVPTPLRKTKDPDMSYIVSACEAISQHLHPEMLVILESTTYPGTTEELVRPMLEKTGLLCGREIFLCFSPERVDPGNPVYHTRNIPKVVGGTTNACTDMGVLFYQQVLEHVVPASSTQVAEMVKLLENTFRMINIGLANEIATMCFRMGIDVWEVIGAAATKPFGFMPFYPGPGLGGHCIPIDPFYLSWKTKQAGIEARFIELAGHINGQMPHFVVDRVQSALNDHGKPLKNSHVHVMGVTYKRDIEDVRESPALDIMHLLAQRHANLTYYDPWVPELKMGGGWSMKSEDVADKADCVIIVADHSSFDYPKLIGSSKLIFDTRNALKKYTGDNIIRL